MEADRVILYIHGMGGGSDSRIPSILSECLPPPLRIVVRTYDFDPEKAVSQIASWIEELRPVVLAGESLGANHALEMSRRYGLPAVLVSPALGAPAALGLAAPLTLIPGVGLLLDRIYRPRPGDRQPLHFRHAVLRKWARLRRAGAPGSAPLRSSPSSARATTTAGAGSCPFATGASASAKVPMPCMRAPTLWRKNTSGPFWQTA